MRISFSALALSSLFLVSGCGSNGATNSSTPVTGASTIYVVNNASLASSTASDTILGYSATANGSSTSTSQITVSPGVLISSLATGPDGSLYALSASSSILVYAAGASGAATPARTISGASTTLAGGNAYSIAVDTTGQVYVAQNVAGVNQVLAFAAGANGNVAPARTISGTNTTFNSIYSVATDSSNNLYVGDVTGQRIDVFSSTASGNVAPTKYISTPNFGLAVDSSGNVYTNTSQTSLAVFSSSASGAATPTRTISTSGVLFYTMAVDAKKTLYVAGFSGTSTGAVFTYSATVSGTASPTTQLTSSAYTAVRLSPMTIR